MSTRVKKCTGCGNVITILIEPCYSILPQSNLQPIYDANNGRMNACSPPPAPSYESSFTTRVPVALAEVREKPRRGRNHCFENWWDLSGDLELTVKSNHQPLKYHRKSKTKKSRRV